MKKGLNIGVYDVAVIGAGVVGCAVARRFALDGARVLMLEKGSDLLSGASKSNSAILHTGFDAPTGSLEVACMQAGYDEYVAIAPQMNLSILETGAIVAAWTDEEVAKLDGIEAQARANGVSDVRRVSRAEILKREPHINPTVREGLLVPREHVIDPWSAPLGYLTQAVQNGATVQFNAEVKGAMRVGNEWEIETTRGEFRASVVINCAGVYGDRIEAMFLGTASFEIRPRKGQFVVFDKSAASFIRTILLPVPTERTKGVVVVRTAFGNVLVGPTAEEQEDRVHATVEESTLKSLAAKAAELVPSLANVPVNAIYAGLRPATEKKEYRVHQDAERGYIALGGIRSTGLTAALGLAQHAAKLYAESGRTLTAPQQVACPRMPNISEHRERDWERPGDNEIVCHCELVTRREIEAALVSEIPAGDFGGLRRRTRACMGRCQGFYCSARVAEITAGKFEFPLAVGVSHE
ncbi:MULTISPECIES: NAD(P)/FAD-dependent oxidoreductase [unclassified Paraburkholderia]|uniref:NAD(P)/FAD-dependent oxidoreductase n=1 Tax=unclassified Paraburkholderia TaxID=2615204 RepID=UPI002AB17090|nr:MULTISPECIES: NAD(P)/FAD-dependent oxidoreductase [unclassified Paraburkholderia]